MTTMDSDSESQDSDEGRRFRFEATRKDSMVGLHSRKRRSSPARPADTRRRSRSVDRGNRDRRNVERGRHDYGKQSRSSLDTRRPLRDGDSKHLKESSEAGRGGSRYKESKDSKVNRDKDMKESRDSKDNKVNRDKDIKESRDSRENRDKDIKESRDSRDNRDKDIKESRDSRDNRDKDIKESRDSRDNRDKDIKESRDSRDNREKDIKESRDGRDNRDKDIKESRDSRDNREKDIKESRDSRDNREKDIKESRDSRDNRDKDIRDSRQNKDIKESRDSKDNKESRESKDNKDNKDKNPSSNSSSNHKGSKVSRESSLKSCRKDCRARERDRRRSGERSSDRFDEKSQDKYANKCSVRSTKRHSRDRSREQSHQGNKPKAVVVAEVGRSQQRDDPSKTESARKIARREDDARSVKDARRNVEVAAANSESDGNSRASSPSAPTDCKDLNLSDFDIVSDIDESSPDNTSSRRGVKTTPPSTRRRGENNPLGTTSCETDTGIRKRVSKQQYERLLKRQAVKNRRSLEELHKVKAEENGEEDGGAPRSGNNNRGALSDSPLGDLAPATTILTDDATSAQRRRRERSRGGRDKDEDGEQSDSDNSRSNGSTYGPMLPPRVSGASGSRKNDGDASRAKEKEKEKTAPRVIGPTMPAHLRQRVDDDGEIDAEDTFGPALPPHLERSKSSADKNSEDDLGSPGVAGDAAKGEDPGGAEGAASEADDLDFMGPLPPDHPGMENDLVQRQLELRARRLKAELAVCDNEDEKKREEWMIELPAPQTVSLGLAPRKFRVRPAPDMSDRSSWTDTPADKARKRMEKLENRNVACEPTISQKRDNNDVCSETEKSRKRQKSLVEIHQKKLQKKKKKEEKEAKKLGKTAERRPFDRDVDLQANRFDEARKKSMLMKSRELDDRFSRGKM